MLAHAILAIATADNAPPRNDQPVTDPVEYQRFQRLLAAGALTTERTLTSPGMVTVAAPTSSSSAGMPPKPQVTNMKSLSPAVVLAR